MAELAALFLYHQDTPVVRRNLDALRAYNPDVPVIVLGQGAVAKIVPDAFTDPSWVPPQDGYHDSDLFVLHALRQLGLPHERYCWLDWDCLVLTGLKDFYAPVYDAAVVAPATQVPWYNPKWSWWCKRATLESYEEHARGIVPLAGCLFSREVLQKLLNLTDLPQDNWCELRLGSAINKLGFEVKVLPPGHRIRYRPEYLLTEVKTGNIWHPVKR
jgi:hypothetical protein